jgi:hypothetical protein
MFLITENNNHHFKEVVWHFKDILNNKPGQNDFVEYFTDRNKYATYNSFFEITLH